MDPSTNIEAAKPATTTVTTNNENGKNNDIVPPPAKKMKRMPKTLDLTGGVKGCDIPGLEAQGVAATAQAKSLRSTIALHNGVHMPIVGFGTYKLQKNDVIEPVKEAFEAGYVLIDSAQVYENERAIGTILATKKRDSFFIETKLWRSSNTYERCLAKTRESLRLLQVDYVDLYLIHWPGCKTGYPLKKGVSCPPDWTPSMRNDTWRAMEDLYLGGKCRAIGVSNFSIRHLKDLISKGRVKPMVLQVEFHPKLMQSELLHFCKDEGIQLQAYASLGSGDSKNGGGSFFTMKGIQDAAKKYEKTPAQILLRWGLEKGVCIIPKSASPSRIRENANIFDFELTPPEVAEIDSNNRMMRNTWKGLDPDSIE
eukprot:GEMP01038580.1.p1 GENE.GEMP01038580.1~~GEMP01038580.1.p1  ORF type:complete len:368 (+),score=95.65 GEMP01038580.1:72-1175(+)